MKKIKIVPLFFFFYWFLFSCTNRNREIDNTIPSAQERMLIDQYNSKVLKKASDLVRETDEEDYRYTIFRDLEKSKEEIKSRKRQAYQMASHPLIEYIFKIEDPYFRGDKEASKTRKSYERYVDDLKRKALSDEALTEQEKQHVIRLAYSVKSLIRYIEKFEKNLCNRDEDTWWNEWGWMAVEQVGIAGQSELEGALVKIPADVAIVFVSAGLTGIYEGNRG